MFQLLMLLLFISISFFPYSAFAESYVVEGEIDYLFEVHSKNKKILDNFYEYENESNSQKVIKREPGKITVRTYTKLDFFHSTAPFPVNNIYKTANLNQYLRLELTEDWYRIEKKNGKTTKAFYQKKLPLSKEKLAYLQAIVDRETKGVRTQQEAVEKLISFLRQNVSYQLGVSSDPVDVIKSGRAFCEGYANAALLLTRILGIPSRKRSCYLPPGHMWGFSGPNNKGSGGFHAFVEIYYKDKGWVSYDPQASIHYVDPFHIVNYPREGVRFKELSLKDTQKIVDAVPYPTNWQHYYKRRTDKKQNNAVIIGTIKNRNKELVKDSVGTNNWLFVRQKDGTGKGIRILESGYFAIPVFDIDKPVNFYFHDKQGAYLEKYILLNQKSPVELNFDLSSPSETTIIQLPENEKELYIWVMGENGKPVLNQLNTAKDGTTALSLSDSSYLFSYSKNNNDPNYSLKMDESLLGKSNKLVDLPLYYNPNGYFVYGQINSRNYPLNKLQIRVSNGSGRYFPVGLDIKGQFSIALPGNDKYQFTAMAEGIMAVKNVDLIKNKNQQIQLNLDDNSGVTLLLNKKAPLVFWQKDAKGEWSLNVNKNKSDSIKMLSETGSYLISQSKIISDNKYILNVKDYQNKSIAITDLPVYRDAKGFSVYGKVLDTNGKPKFVYVNINSSSGHYFPFKKSNSKGEFSYPIPEKKFNIVKIQVDGLLYIEQLNLNKSSHVEINLNLKSAKLSKISGAVSKGSIYIWKGENNRYYPVGECRADKNGNLLFKVPDGKYFVTETKRLSKNMKSFVIKGDRAVQINLK